MSENKKTLRITCIVGVVISWALLILGSCALKNMGGELVNTMASSLLVANGIISTMVYIRMLKKQNELRFI